jgi:hypothetical protein
LFALPASLGIGWVIHFFWMIGIGNRIFTILLALAAVSSMAYLLYTNRWEVTDLRWSLSPLLVISLALYLPWWSYTSSQHTDTFYHILEANNFFGGMDWVPTHQGMDFLFRPPLIPGFLALELALNDDSTWVIYSSLFLFSVTLWQLQHLAERWTTKFRAALVVPVFLLLPVARYWGQLPLLDVAVAGMFILTIHTLLMSDDNIQSKKLALSIGLLAGMTFLTKYVFIYTIGIGLWLLLADRNRTRASWFLFGWIISTAPFLLYHQITQGDPFSALTPQSNFAISSITETLGSYTSSQWFWEYQSQLFGFGILFTLLGLFSVGVSKPKDLLSILTLTLPLIFIHAYILDFGTLRYHTPWIALSVVLIVASIPIDVKRFTSRDVDWEKISRLCRSLSLGSVIIIASLHLSTLNEEREHYEELIPERDRVWEFYLDASEMVPEDSILLTSKYIPIALNTGLHTERYVHSDNPMSDSINSTSATYALTSNLQPYQPWEKNLLPLLGNEMIEPFDIHQVGDDAAVLWVVGFDPWIPIQSPIQSNGTIYGNMILLSGEQTVEFEVNSTVKWISIPSGNSTIGVVNLYLENNSVVSGTCSDMDGDFGYCEIQQNGVIKPKTNHDLYLWLLDE